MPFITNRGGLILNHDQHEGKKPIPLGCGMQYDFIKYGKVHKEVIWRGTPIKEDFRFSDTPVFRIPTNRFGPDEWKRFIDFYDLNQKQAAEGGSEQVYYEPHPDDIVIPPVILDFKKHFPTWVIDYLVTKGAFDIALKRNKVGQPVEDKMLTQDEYDGIMQLIKQRKEAEKAGALEGDSEEHQEVGQAKKNEIAAENMNAGRKKQAKEKRDEKKALEEEIIREELAKKADEKLSKVG